MKALEKKKEYPKIIKKLVLLRIFKSQNRRIKCLCDLAHKYQKMLALMGPLNISASPAGMNAISEDPPKPVADVVAEPIVDVAESVIDIEKVTIDKETEATPLAETSLEASSSELHEALTLKGLPQRLHMPAPRMLCRPSALRWVKPCCTRSCYENLEHVVTIRYSKCPKLLPKLD
ncbi:TP53-target gene 5 protein isoform X2 [Sceloporus undulatus]|uniref:TP53-target gene 5 protein isoform X2 n=1 Tax=Sceloporus undulatus TaxID=8520 RepID=UPI001C4D919F|nr:TP53-target gene 5 protein isoform X2 [Sceloporus undulatus]